MKEMPVIDYSKCNGCGLCVGVCGCGALIIVNQHLEVREVDNCHWCTICEMVCPLHAITCPFEIVIEPGQESA